MGKTQGDKALDTAAGRAAFVERYRAPLERAYLAGRREYADLPALPFETFAEHIAHAIEHAGQRVSIGSLCADDLYLAAHCAAGTDAAWRVLAERHLPAVAAYALKMDPTLSSVEAARDTLLADLAVCPEGSNRPRIASYDGTGRLGAWLTAIAYRKVVDGARRRRTEQTLHEALVLRLPRDGADPATQPVEIAIRAEWDRFFRLAVPEALRSLAPRDQALIRLHHFGGVEQKVLARTYRMSEWQLSRLMKGLYATVRDHLERAAAEALAAEPADLRAVQDLIAGHVAGFFEQDAASQ